MTRNTQQQWRNEKMRFKPVLAALPLLAVLLMAIPAMAKPTPVSITIHQAQFQWRAWAGTFDDWTYSYLNTHFTNDYTLTGNVLHGLWTYQPYVNNEEGGSTIYAYDAETGCWIEHEGTVTYQYSKYGDDTVTNYFRGYLRFNGEPSANTFAHGVAYQWVYLYSTPDETLLPYAQWDEKMGAWLVGFSIYIWDATSFTQEYDPLFPDPFPLPAPASSYNPLDL